MQKRQRKFEFSNVFLQLPRPLLKKTLDSLPLVYWKQVQFSRLFTSTTVRAARILDFSISASIRTTDSLEKSPVTLGFYLHIWMSCIYFGAWNLLLFDFFLTQNFHGMLEI